MIKLVMFIWFFIASLLTSNANILDESFNCEGTLLVQRNYKKVSKPINNGETAFRFDRKDTRSLSIFVPGDKKASVKVFPWNGIDHKLLVPPKKQSNISVSTTGEKIFNIQIKRDKDKFYLSCNYFE